MFESFTATEIAIIALIVSLVAAIIAGGTFALEAWGFSNVIKFFKLIFKAFGIDWKGKKKAEFTPGSMFADGIIAIGLTIGEIDPKTKKPTDRAIDMRVALANIFGFAGEIAIQTIGQKTQEVAGLNPAKLSKKDQRNLMYLQLGLQFIQGMKGQQNPQQAAQQAQELMPIVGGVFK